MATAAQTIVGRTFSFSWLGQFLKEELSPYPGRFALVARMVLVTTIVMILSMTFKLSFGFQGAIIALFVSHESPRSTLQSAWTMFLSTALGALYLLISAWFVMSVPALHLLWIFGSFFIAFYVLSALNNYAAAAIFCVMIAVGVPLWDRHVPAERNVEDTLRLLLTSTIGTVSTLGVELAFAHRKPGERVIQPIAEQLDAVGGLLACFAEGRPVDEAMAANITRLGMVGTSRLRRILRRCAYTPHFAEQMSAVMTLTETLIDIANNLTPPNSLLSDEDKARVRRLAGNLGTIRTDLLEGKAPHLSEPFVEGNILTALPFLPEMERTVSLIPEAFVGSRPLSVYVSLPSSGDPPQSLFAGDTRTNGEHIRFALKGCLTASLCYVFYNLVAWQGISTSVTTCFLTALTTIGASRQKQVLRFAGAAVGGFVFGMGSQIFILPHLNSIGGFTVLFIFVTAVSSYVITSGPRLSYFGAQLALAYYLINLQEFAIQPSLAIARDRVVGVLFGLLMMWLVFDQLWGVPAAVEMKRTFISNLRLLARFAGEPLSEDLGVAAERGYALRENISKSFDSVRAFADAVLFEFGPSRQQDLAWRARIVRWRPQLRAIFLTRIALWKYRARMPGFELPKDVLSAQKEFDDQSAKILNGIADRVEGKPPTDDGELETSFKDLEQVSRILRSERGQVPAPQLEAFLVLSRRLQNLEAWLNQEI